MSPEPNPNPDHPTPDDPLFRDYLLAMLETGNALLQGIKRQAEAETPPETPPETPKDLAEHFERVSRAMRRTILLARHIAQNRSAMPQRVQARKRIIRDVEDAIQRAPRNNEALQAEFLDRLDSPDLEEEIATRPTADIILDIRRDLGLENMLGNHPWARRTPRDIDTLRTRAAAAAPPAYTPAPHGPDLGGPDPRGPDNPNLCPHPPDPARERHEMYALARRLSRL